MIRAQTNNLLRVDATVVMRARGKRGTMCGTWLAAAPSEQGETEARAATRARVQERICSFLIRIAGLLPYRRSLQRSCRLCLRSSS